MFLGLVFLPIAGLIAAGGWSPMVDGLSSIDPIPTNWSGSDEWDLRRSSALSD